VLSTIYKLGKAEEGRGFREQTNEQKMNFRTISLMKIKRIW
jgi:hypothetical protein